MVQLLLLPELLVAVLLVLLNQPLEVPTIRLPSVTVFARTPRLIL